MRALRTTGGLDRHFEEYERASGATEQVEVETLEDAERDAAGLSVAQYADQLREQHDALQAIRDDEHGIELTTVHREGTRVANRDRVRARRRTAPAQPRTAGHR